ncbi:MAG: hypothetical protein ACLPX5_13185 [Dissulfurispiraceae bacterium]
MLFEIILLVLCFCIVGGGIYLGQYLSDKAKNLASREDVAAITRQIEAAKIDYSRQIEEFKSDLHHQWDLHSEYGRDRKEALLRFFESCTSLLADKLNANPGDFPSDDGASLYRYQQVVGELFTRIYLDYLRLSLYFPGDSDLMTQAEMLTKYSFEARRDFESHFAMAKLALLEEWKAHASDDKAAYRNAVQRSNKASRSYNEALRPSIQGMNQHFLAYLAALNAYLKEIGSRPAPPPKVTP